MEKCGVGAALFVPSRILGDARPFWWDAIAEIVLCNPKLPSRLQLDLPRQLHTWDIPNENRELSSGEKAFLAQWGFLKPYDESLRARLNREIWTALQ